MIIDFQDIAPSERYKITTNIVIPRPIAWIVTEGGMNGKIVTNIAPFSYFTPLSSEPATLVVSIGHRPDGSPKDTLRNLRETKRCTICIVDTEHLEQMDLSSASLDAGLSEIEEYDISTNGLLDGYPPAPVDIKVAMFGTYLREIDLGGRTMPVIIEIDHVYIDDSIITDKEKIRIELDAVARLGGRYVSLGEEM